MILFQVRGFHLCAVHTFRDKINLWGQHKSFWIFTDLINILRFVIDTRYLYRYWTKKMNLRILGGSLNVLYVWNRFLCHCAKGSEAALIRRYNFKNWIEKRTVCLLTTFGFAVLVAEPPPITFNHPPRDLVKTQISWLFFSHRAIIFYVIVNRSSKQCFNKSLYTFEHLKIWQGVV